MALIKCPECGKDVSSTLNACPHCGYTIENAEELVTENKDNGLIVVIKRNVNVPNGMYTVFIFVGLILSLAIIGLTILATAICMKMLIAKNNAQVKDILYYDPNKNVFIAYDVKGKEYVISKENVSKFVNVKQGAQGYTGVLYKNWNQLGWTTVEDNNYFREFLKKM